MTEAAFVLSVALAHAMTNLDNLVVMLVLAPVIGSARCVIAYAGAQVTGIAVSGVAGSAALGLLGAWVGYVGFIPIGFGVFALWQQGQGDGAATAARPASTGAAFVLFLGLSVDTIVIMAALFGDSAGVWKGLSYLGAALSLCAIIALFRIMSHGRMSKALIERIGRLAPYAMILVGAYIVSNSFSDAI